MRCVTLQINFVLYEKYILIKYLKYILAVLTIRGVAEKTLPCPQKSVF